MQNDPPSRTILVAQEARKSAYSLSSLRISILPSLSLCFIRTMFYDAVIYGCDYEFITFANYLLSGPDSLPYLYNIMGP